MYENIIARVFAVDLPQAPTERPPYPGNAAWNDDAEQRRRYLLLAAYLRERIQSTLDRLPAARAELAQAEAQERAENLSQAELRRHYMLRRYPHLQDGGVLFYANNDAYALFPNVNYCVEPAKMCMELQRALENYLLLCVQALRNADEGYVGLFLDTCKALAGPDARNS